MAEILHKLAAAELEESPERAELAAFLREHGSGETPQDYCQKVRAAIDVVRRTLALYPVRGGGGSGGYDALRAKHRPRIGLSFNGGKDCTVVLHVLLAALAGDIDNVNDTGSSARSTAVSSSSSLRQLVLPFYFSTGDVFPEETTFIESTAANYFLEAGQAPADGSNSVQLLRLDNCSNKEGVSQLVETHGIEAILMGTRSTDPDGRWLSGVFWPSSKGWPPFMRINPCLNWSYQDVWIFLRFFGISYCALYDYGYTSIGSRSTSRPNPHLRATPASNRGDGDCDGKADDGSPEYMPAYKLLDGSLERAGRG